MNWILQVPGNQGLGSGAKVPDDHLRGAQVSSRVSKRDLVAMSTVKSPLWAARGQSSSRQPGRRRPCLRESDP